MELPTKSMTKKAGFPLKFLLPLFIAMIAIQLYVPAQMIFGKEKVLQNGTAYKFRTAPVDPYDPFRGKYVALDYRNTRVTSNLPLEREQSVYAIIENDEKGFAKIQSISLTKPNKGQDYFEAEVDRVNRSETSNSARLRFPFDRLYMEESKAYEAEKLHRQMRRDTSHATYALVKIKDGTAVLEDVYVDEKSLKELVKERRLNTENSK